MPKWSDYKKEARERGSLAFELYMVQSVPAAPAERMLDILPDHLAYQGEMERAGKLFLAGPLSDGSGEEMSGAGLIVYRAASLDEAVAFAEADPMHARGGRKFTVRKWLVNEGSISFSANLSTGGSRLA